MESSEAHSQGCWRNTRSGASAKRSRSTACSRAGGGDVLRAKWSRSRMKRSSGVEGEEVEVMACSGHWRCQGVLRKRPRRRRRRPKVHEW
jgi:hypothetical protein